MRRILLLLALILPFAATPVGASPITFEFVCTSPSDCDGDAAFSFRITLDSSVVVAGGSYTATLSSHAGFLGWSATSSVGTYAGHEGFSIAGTYNLDQLQDLNSLNDYAVMFTFDNAGSLSTVASIYKGTSSAADGTVFKFANQVCASCYGEGGYISWVEPNTIGARVDGYTGGSIGRTLDDTDIRGVWVRAAAIPEPGTLALLGLGLVGLAFTRRRKH